MKYMLACYRSGEQWRALESFQQLRCTMVEELGVDPSGAIPRLHTAILGRDPALEDNGFGTIWPPTAVAG